MRILKESDWDLLDFDSLMEHKSYMEVNKYEGNEIYIEKLEHYIGMVIEGMME